MLVAKFDVGAAGAHTKTSGVNGKGVASVARTAAGSYTVTFARGIPSGPFITAWGVHHATAAAHGLKVRPTKTAGFTAETAAAAATLTMEAWDAATPTKTEIPNGDQVTYFFLFQKTK